jgi:hypothetical protein
MDGSVNQPGEIIRVWMVLGLIDADKCAASHSVNCLVGGGQNLFSQITWPEGHKTLLFFFKKII